MTPAKKVTKKRSQRPKSAKDTATNVTPTLIPQPNGRGALLSGGMPGNAGGGRTPSIVKELAAGKLPRHVETLDVIADGKVFVTLVGKCKACGHEGQELLGLPQDVKPGDRVRAIEALAKLAEGKELVITAPDAGAFFDCVYRAMVEQHGEQGAELVKLRAVVLMDSKA